MIDKPSNARTVTTCQHCGWGSFPISKALELCLDCIRKDFARVLPLIEKAHRVAREPFNLPEQPPRGEVGLNCHLCANNCCIPPGGRGYCGLRSNLGNRIVGANAKVGNVSWYHNSLPTNCVADWVCPGCTEAGYPLYTHSKWVEYNYKNLAVFYQACSFDCLYCQNWHNRYEATGKSKVDALEIAQAVDVRTSCICYFGGDPSPQLPHAIRASWLALEMNKGRILRICWGSNGSMHPALLKQAAELSLNSGGCIKFDLKAWSQELDIAPVG